jgi:two-component system nitrogen regulation response regulator GlnG
MWRAPQLPWSERYLASLDWPGNVRQLENTCRWLTVMASGNEIHLEDLPPELREDAQGEEGEGDWAALLRRWAERKLAAGGERILDEAVPRFEQVMIETALRFSHGRRQDAARLLGWDRNTLTRKIKEHEKR